MRTRSLHKRIKRNKAILNFLLNYLSPSNSIIIYLSQKLDKQLVKAQRSIYIKHRKTFLFINIVHHAA